jgi:3-oxoacyl-[acyl-carrier-protein] synthase-1
MDASSRIWITGIGIASSIGMNAQECLVSIRSGKRGIHGIRILETVHSPDYVAGEIPFTNGQLMRHLGIPEVHSSRYTRTSLLGMVAAREACSMALVRGDNGIRTALVSATTVGGMDKTEQHFATREFASGFVQTHPCGDSTDRIAGFIGINGYRTTLSTACSSGANAVIHGARLIRHGIVERAVVGGTDALCRFTFNGFNSLMILDREPCRPFDRNRRGLNLGEGAGYLVLESDRLADSRGSRKLCRLAGYANTNDAFHQTASSPEGEGAFLAMTQALAMSGISTSEVNYINAHGTGTENNDASEGAALLRVFGDKLPAFSSTKSFTGHTLGAAAGVEAVFSVLSIVEGLIPPNLGFQDPIESLGIRPQVVLREGEVVKNVLSNSFGFGGNNSSLVFSLD